jgi:chromosome segregation ATPase
MDIQKEEFQQLISNEEKLTKEYEAKAQAYLDSDPLQAEIENLELECGELQYELTKHNHQIRTQAIEIDQMKATVNSYNRSISRLTGSIRNSKNNTQDILQNSGSLRYEYKEKSRQDTIPEASRGQEESSYYK